MAVDPKEARAKAAGRVLDAGEQLGLFAGDGQAVPVERRAGPGRPPGATNKIKAKLRDLMAVRGYRDPAEQLAMIAGLDRPDVHPMALAAAIAAELGEDMVAVVREMRLAAGELMPYWHPKLTPDVAVTAPAVNILMAGADGSVAVQVGGAAAGADPFAPLDVRLDGGAGRIGETVEHQQVSGAPDDGADDAARTEGAKR